MLDGIDEPALGSEQVIALLEYYLEKAKLDRINYACISVMSWPNHIACDIAGSIKMEGVALESLDRLKKRIENEQSNREMPPRDPEYYTADRVCYDLVGGPGGFDFVPWLVDAEMTRRREGAPFPLKVAFWLGKDGKAGLNTEYHQQMLNCVMRPLLPLIGAIEDPTSMVGRDKGCVHYQDIVPACRNGEEVPRFKPSEKLQKLVAEAFGGRQFVTITLREAKNWLHRNSNIPEWIKFANWLRDRGELVTFVRDTAKAEEPISGFPTSPFASINIDARCALYEAAKCNLFVSNGPHCLALFGTKPWMAFFEVNEADKFIAHRPSWWHNDCGIDAGEQFPWCSPKQRFIWKCDKFENMIEAWESFQPGLSIAA